MILSLEEENKVEKTKIDWCDSTWNPVTGCFHECEYCYARGIAHRFSGGGENWEDEETIQEFPEQLMINTKR